MRAGSTLRWVRRTGRVLGLAMLGCASAGSASGVGGGLAMPRALEGLAPAGSQCGRTQAEQQLVDQGRLLPRPDYACALSAEEALREQGKGRAPAVGRVTRWLWVDARRPHLSEADLQPDSLRMSVDEMLGKHYLKDKPVLVVSDGMADSQLLAQCGRLREAGFANVRVLMGGWPQYRLLRALDAANGSEVGVLPPPAQLDAGLVWAASQDESQLVIGLKADGLTGLLPFSATVESWSVGAVRAAMERRRKAVKHPPLLGLTLLSARGAQTPLQINALRIALRPIPLAVYEGDRQEMQQQLAQVEATWAARERGPKQPRCGQ